MDKWLDRPIFVKLISLIIGVILFAVVHFDPVNEKTNNIAPLYITKVIDDVKIEPYGLNEHVHTLVDMKPHKAKIIVRATRSDFNAAQGKGFRLNVDLRNIEEGRHVLPIVENLPRGITALSIEPSSVSVEVEEFAEKEFPVSLETQGEPAAGFKTALPIIKPTLVKVRLPAARLKEVTGVGANLNIAGQRETVNRKNIPVVVYGRDGHPIEGAQTSPTTIDAQIPIAKSFKNVPLKFKMTGQLQEGLRIASFKPSFEKATINGPDKAINQIREIEVEVPIENLHESGTVHVPIKEKDASIQISPAFVDIDIGIVPPMSRTFEHLSVQLTGLQEGLEAKVIQPSSGEAEITLSGDAQPLKKISNKDIKVSVNLANKGTGKFVVPLQVKVPDGLKQKGGTKNVTVEIKQKAEETKDKKDPKLPEFKKKNEMPPATEPQKYDE